MAAKAKPTARKTQPKGFVSKAAAIADSAVPVIDEIMVRPKANKSKAVYRNGDLERDVHSTRNQYIEAPISDTNDKNALIEEVPLNRLPMRTRGQKKGNLIQRTKDKVANASTLLKILDGGDRLYSTHSAKSNRNRYFIRGAAGTLKNVTFQYAKSLVGGIAEETKLTNEIREQTITKEKVEAVPEVKFEVLPDPVVIVKQTSNELIAKTIEYQESNKTDLPVANKNILRVACSVSDPITRVSNSAPLVSGAAKLMLRPGYRR